MSHDEVDIFNHGADNVPYFTPAQDPPSGTIVVPSNGAAVPRLFQPLTIRGLTFRNRIWVSPLCQYSAEDGKMTAWHMSQLGGWLSRGPGLTMIEGTAVAEFGRIDPNGLGLWKDEQIASIKEVVDFAHSQSQLIAIQLFHSGRKGSSVAPWLGNHKATKKAGGFGDKLIGPSAVPYGAGSFVPKEMTLSDIEDFRRAWVEAVERSLKAGFDVIEIHAAHGFLLHSFLSPVSNKRTDKYGGSFENRIRLLLEVIHDTRCRVGEKMPLFLRVSATDWLEETDIEGWTVEDTAKLSLRAAEVGIDFIDVSSGGSSPFQKVKAGPAYQASFSKYIKSVVKNKVLVGAVGTITNGVQANDLLEDGLDAIFNGRLFQKNPGLVWAWADDLGVIVYAANQMKWGFKSIPGRRRVASAASS